MGGSRSSRVFWTMAFVLWLCVVWGHSLMPADLSSMESAGPTRFLMPLFELFGVRDEHLMTHIVRKVAHFSEYAVLMALWLKTLLAWEVKPFMLALTMAIFVWMAVPCVDESIQLFVPGRDGRPSDVLLDMAGGAFGLALLSLKGRRHS